MARIAFVLADDFEDSEFQHPYDALVDDGHDVDVIGVTTGTVTGKGGTTHDIETTVADTAADDYDALVIPGGFSPDHLRTDDGIVEFVRALHDREVPVAAVCHAPSLLIEAGVVAGRTLTSWPSIRTDLTNAGAIVLDDEVIVDGNLITSRNPDDLPAFTKHLLAALPGSDA